MKVFFLVVALATIALAYPSDPEVFVVQSVAEDVPQVQNLPSEDDDLLETAESGYYGGRPGRGGGFGGGGGWGGGGGFGGGGGGGGGGGFGGGHGGGFGGGFGGGYGGGRRGHYG